MQLTLIAVALSAAVVLCAPASDPDYKPVLAPPTPDSSNADDYAPLSSPWREPKPEKLPNPLAPQTGSLLSTEATVVAGQVDPDLIIPKSNNASSMAVAPAKANVAEMPHVKIDHDPAANPINSHYPVEKDPTVPAYKESNEAVAPPPVIDPTQKDVFGAQPPPVVFDRPELIHPMEVKTPIPDTAPCDPERILNVTVVSATQGAGQSRPYLPLRFGCSSATDVSREKVSPEVFWNNVSEDVVDFSLQMIDMGDNCEAKGPEYGRIHWHIEGIKAAPSVTLKEGASHDSRLLFGGKEQPNQWLEEYYGGPCPTPSVTGCYRFKVLAHRANGRCQCGYQDVLFARPQKIEDGTLIIDAKAVVA